MDGNKTLTANFQDPGSLCFLELEVLPANRGIISRDPAKTFYTPGDIVTLTAIPNSSALFSHWSGDSDSTEKTIEVVMDGNKSFTANFVQAFSFTYSHTPPEGGSVKIEPEMERYPHGTIVTITAEPAEEFMFIKWTGTGIPAGQAYNSSITVSMTGTRNYVAEFERLEASDIFNLTSMEVTELMGPGWNLGNSLDSHWNEQGPWLAAPEPNDIEIAWGNPKTTKAMIDKVKEAGFNTVRVPVTWYIFLGPAPDYKIEDRWMNRVQEVVDYVIDNGMYCILNTHHDEYWNYGAGINGWLRLFYTEPTGSATRRELNSAERKEMNDIVRSIWAQISDRFKTYDEYLIFEGLNEPRTKQNMGGNSADRWAAQYSVLNEMLQTFIDTVRAGGGRNINRHLMVTPHFAQFNLPNNTVANGNGVQYFMDTAAGKLKVTDPRDRLIVSLHFYEPYYFCMAGDAESNVQFTYDTNDGHVSTNRERVLSTIKSNFIDNGIPVVMGETGAVRRDGVTGHEDERIKWVQDYITRVRQIGVPIVIWDDGGAYQLLDRTTRTWVFPSLMNAFVNASR